MSKSKLPKDIGQSEIVYHAKDVQILNTWDESNRPFFKSR